MIPAKIDSISITTPREKGVEAIVDWFDQQKQSFYILGLFYLRNQQQMEELFYRSILKVHKELPLFKREASFETRVTSIFIHICRELSKDRSLQDSEESESRQGLFKALDQLKEYEKEAMVLTYIKGISKEETADLLQVSVEEIKEHLFSGIQSLRKELGNESSINGCKEYHKNYIDYLDRTLDRTKKVDFEVHISQCQDCQEDLAAFQDVMLTMLHFTERNKDFLVPSDFMEKVNARLTEKEKQRQLKIKKRKSMGIVLASVFALLIGIGVFTGSFTNIYYTWAEEDPELRAFLQHGLGKRLNMVAESNGVKIKIKSAIADDVQTLVFYEIEDTAENNQYAIDLDEGISVENVNEIMNGVTHPIYYPPDIKSDVNNKEKNVYHGKTGLMPLTTGKGTIKLKITKLRILTRDSSDGNELNPNIDYKSGEWSFEIPVTKHSSIEYALNKETKVEGIPVRFNKLTIAPTATILEFSVKNEMPGKQIDFLTVDNLEVNNKKVKANNYDNSFIDSNMDGKNFETNFAPLFGEKPKEVNVQFGRVNLLFEDPKNIELGASVKYPQNFEYAGSTISIDKKEVGQSTNIVISNLEIENRAYDILNFNIVYEENGNEISSMETSSEGVLVDKNGIKYDINENPAVYEKIEQPRYFDTVQNIRLKSKNSGENVIPKRLEIYGYHTLKYVDDVVKIKLK